MTSPPCPIITLTTDFGLEDIYVAAMKGVILSTNPSCQLVDVTHAIPPQHVRLANMMLAAVAPLYPPGSIHLVVVDPGVGSARAPIAVRTNEAFYVAPNNGVLTDVLQGADCYEAVVLENPDFRRRHVSHTFHGRDIFAPAAAALSRGAPLADLGPPCNDLLMLSSHAPEVTADGISGQVLFVDHFGNIVSDIPASKLTSKNMADISVTLNGETVTGVKQTYSDVPVGSALMLINSFGLLEVAVREGHAANTLSTHLGAPLRIMWQPPT